MVCNRQFIFIHSKPTTTDGNMFELKDHVSAGQINDFCRKNHIIKMSLYGSALQGDLKPDSNIDILVEFEKGHVPGLLDLAGMEMEFSEMTGLKVDLRTPAELSRYFRDDVIQKARVEYVGSQ